MYTSNFHSQCLIQEVIISSKLKTLKFMKKIKNWLKIDFVNFSIEGYPYEKTVPNSYPMCYFNLYLNNTEVKSKFKKPTVKEFRTILGFIRLNLFNGTASWIRVHLMDA